MWEGEEQRVTLAHTTGPFVVLAQLKGLQSGCASGPCPQSCKGSGKLKQGKGSSCWVVVLVRGGQREMRVRGVGQGQKDLEGSS